MCLKSSDKGPYRGEDPELLMQGHGFNAWVRRLRVLMWPVAAEKERKKNPVMSGVAEDRRGDCEEGSPLEAGCGGRWATPQTLPGPAGPQNWGEHLRTGLNRLLSGNLLH